MLNRTLLPLLLLLLALPISAAPVRVGIIGVDTSHALAFTKELNNPEVAEDLAGFRVVAAYPKGSEDIESSTSRIPANTETLRGMGIEIVDSIEALLKKVDVVLLETNDGKPHLRQALPVIQAGKPLFIDKPVAASLADALAIFDAARKHKVPMFSSSSLRYTPGAQAIRAGEIGTVVGCDAYSPAPTEPSHPDFFWYGIHGVETLFTCMGPGCIEVTRTSTEGMDVAVGKWSDGRLGTFRGLRTGKRGYGGTAFGTKNVKEIGNFAGYRPLVVEIVKFFRTGVVPIDPRETLEIYAFMEAADESLRRGGVPVKLSDVMERAAAKAGVPLP